MRPRIFVVRLWKDQSTIRPNAQLSINKQQMKPHVSVCALCCAVVKWSARIYLSNQSSIGCWPAHNFTNLFSTCHYYLTIGLLCLVSRLYLQPKTVVTEKRCAFFARLQMNAKIIHSSTM